MDTHSETVLRSWLQSIEGGDVASDPAIASLGRMLQGFKLGLSADEEPYLHMYNRAVALRCVWEVSLVAAALLERWLNGEWQPSLREKAHYNLLHLCTEIGDRKRLGRPTWELYRRRLVSGEYQGFRPIPLTQALLKAMIRNPSDTAEAAELWKLFLSSNSDGYVEGTPLDGFIGMLYLPEHAPQSTRIQELAMCLLVLHGMKEENLFLNALASLKRVEPALALAVVERAGLDFCKTYIECVTETAPRLIESALQELNERGNHRLAEELEQKLNRVCVRLENGLKASAEDQKLRSKHQIESFLLALTYQEFNPRENMPDRVLCCMIREFASPREPQSLRPYQMAV